MAKKQPSTEKKSKTAKPATTGAKPTKAAKAAKNVEGAPASAAEATSPASKKKPSSAAKTAAPARAITLEEIGLAAGEVWGALTAEAREFKTGSTGYYANGKVKNPKNGFPYQVGTNVILIGSKE